MPQTLINECPVSEDMQHAKLKKPHSSIIMPESLAYNAPLQFWALNRQTEYIVAIFKQDQTQIVCFKPRGKGI